MKRKDAFLLENYSKNQRGGNLNHFCSPKLWFLVLNIISYLCPFPSIGSNQTKLGLRSGDWGVRVGSDCCVLSVHLIIHQHRFP